jgi:hypothetical protein
MTTIEDKTIDVIIDFINKLSSITVDGQIVTIDYLLKNEIWCEIPGFPKYEISSCGRVRHKINKNILKQYINNQYLTVRLCITGRDSVPCLVHRLLALTFIPNPKPDEYKVIDHIDGNKLNNSLANLRWCSDSENMVFWNEKRTNYKKVIQCNLKGEEIKIWNSALEAANELKIDRQYIMDCANPKRKSKTYKSFIWKYVKDSLLEDIDYSEYTSIGKIDNLDFSNYYIKNDGSTIVNRDRNREMEYCVINGYKRICLSYNPNEYKSLLMHKIINHALLGGNYDDMISHVDKNRANNDLTNLKVISTKENTIEVAINQIDIRTGEIIATFASIADINTKFGRDQDIGLVEKATPKFGFLWKRVDDKTPKLFIIRQIDLKTKLIIEEFNSVRLAITKFGSKEHGMINRVLRNERNKAFGFYWDKLFVQ